MMENNNIEHTCTFTGHRPEKLGVDPEIVKEWLKEEIGKSVQEGYTDFITGMAKGVDLWAAEEVLRLKNIGAYLRLIAAVPFKYQERDWDPKWQEKYKRVLDDADEIHYISNRPGRAAFFERNEWMVDRASKLIAVYTGKPGGTKQTIEYAKKLNRKIVVF